MSIVAKVVFQKLEIGQEFYLADWYEDIEKVTVVEKLHWFNHCYTGGGVWIFKVKNQAGKVIEVYPGDSGMGKLAYDNRPCTCVNTYEEAVAAKAAKYQWWRERQGNSNRYWWHQ